MGQPKFPAVGKLIKKWYIYAIYYSAIEKNELLIFETMWINLEGYAK